MVDGNGSPRKEYRRRGGRPALNVDFVPVCDAVVGARNGSGETMTDLAARFGVSRGWIHKWIYPTLKLRRSGWEWPRPETWASQPGRPAIVNMVDAELVSSLREPGKSWSEIAEAHPQVKSASGRKVRPSVGSIRRVYSSITLEYRIQM